MNQSPVESHAGRGSALPPDAWRREAVIVIDSGARVVEWNAAASLMFGVGRQEAIGRHVGTMIVPAARCDGHQAHWDALRADGAPAEWSFEALTMLARGEEVPVGVRVTRIGAESPHFILSVRDKSGREPTEQAHRQLRTIIDSAEDAMATLSVDGTVTSWNAAAERLYGWTAAEVLGTRLHPRLIPDDRAHEPGEWLMAIRRGATIERETSRLHKNGDQIWVYVRLLPVRDDAGGVTGAVWIARDVTDRHRLEERERFDEEARRQGKEIARALAEDLFLFAAQPVIDLATGSLDHYELLIRMRGLDGDLALPGSFLPQAERSGQIVEIDFWAIKHGIRLAARAPVAINLSGASIARGGLIEEVEERLGHSGVDPGRVTFEITETAAAEDIDRAAELIERLGELGCGIALDDFGTGFGTFTYLHRLAVSELKIDREFVSQVRDSATNQRVVRTMIAVANNFGMRTVAEGIEDQGTLRSLVEMGVDLGQGFLLGRPALIEASWGVGIEPA
ncbi:MAG TPA: EAL domain-containing protein [Solirubrobacterales bacterium]|nr:EAL domain-containing protein [Solirubrobacterales bacterium]